MNADEQKTYDRLLQKFQEAFLLAIELYNRPSIRYHVEGCAFFLCNDELRCHQKSEES